jgi:SNF2 family DNA or RNA helicase
MPSYTPYHSQYLAHRLTLEGVTDDAFARSLSAARVDLNPHQVDAALFALSSPISHGVLLADEVGLGKTIEASLVIAQRWAEHRRRILLVVPASLRKQWSQELQEKFSLPSVILEARTYREQVKAGQRQPFTVDGQVVITSYEFAAHKADDVARHEWDLVVFDEAHRLRNVYRKGTAVRAKALRDAVRGRFKLLLTATPLQNSLGSCSALPRSLTSCCSGTRRASAPSTAVPAPARTTFCFCASGSNQSATARCGAASRKPA